MLVPARPFPAELRRQLGPILRRVRPRLEAETGRFIAQLQEAADVVIVIHAGPDPAADGAMLDMLASTSRRFRRALKAAIVRGLLEVPKARLGYAADLEAKILEGLDILEALQAGARPRRRRPKGGRPRGGTTFAGRWFAAQVATVLRGHGARPSQHIDGVFADLLRALWPRVIGAELPGDIRRLLKDAVAE